MIKNAKKNAKSLIKTHYKDLFVCSTIYMLLQAFDYLFFNVIISHLYWENFNYLLRIVFLILFYYYEDDDHEYTEVFVGKCKFEKKKCIVTDLFITDSAKKFFPDDVSKIIFEREELS